MSPVLLFTFGLAFLVCVLVTPRVREHARRRGILDLPDKERKLHLRETPLGGGFAVFLAVVSAVGAVMLAVNLFAAELDLEPSSVIPLVFSSIVILILGLADDVLDLRVRQKLLGQCVAISILIVSGMRIDRLGILNTEIELGLLAIPFTMAWLLFAINSLNLLDGADGFASTIGIVICATLAAMSSYQGNLAEVVIAAAMAGALAGFLIFNFPPSSIFLGESGSMLIGLVVGALALQSNLKSAATFALATPIALLSIPLLDSVAAIIRRSLTGRAIVTGDRAHIHHAMMRRGFGPRRLVFAAVILSLIPTLGALFSVRLNNEAIAWGSLVALALILVGGKVFGFNEIQLITHRTVRFCESLLFRTTGISNSEQRVGLLDSGHCAELWDRLVKFADEYALSRVRFDLKGSWMDDGHDVLWEYSSRKYEGDNWQITVPVFAKDRLFGKVHVAGNVYGNSGQHILAPMGELLRSLGPLIEELVDDAASQGVAMQEGMAKRILFINRSYWPDVEATGQLLTELCEDLSGDFAVSVLAGQPNHVTNDVTFHRSGVQRRNGVDIYRVRHTKFSKSSMVGKSLNLISFTLAATWQSFFIPKHEVVIVESDPFLLAILGGWIKRWRNSKFVMYVQDVYPDVAVEIGKIHADGWMTKLIRGLMTKSYERADRVVVLSNDMRSRLVRNGVDAKKIQVIPNWVDCDAIYPIKENNEFRVQHGVNNKFVVMHSGNMGLTQQLDQLLDVASQLKQREDIVFMLVGDGAAAPRLQRMASARKLTNVRFLPYQPREDLSISLSAADLHLVLMHPRISGCLAPSKMYGIMASATAMLAVCPKSTDLFHIVRDNSIGQSVDAEETADLGAIIQEFADDPEGTVQMGHRARLLAAEEYHRPKSVLLFRGLLATLGTSVESIQPKLLSQPKPKAVASVVSPE